VLRTHTCTHTTSTTITPPPSLPSFPTAAAAVVVLLLFLFHQEHSHYSTDNVVILYCQYLNLFNVANSVTDFPVVNTLSYQYSIFSDRCTSSSLDCPYNIEQSVQKSKPVTPTYTPPPRTYTPAPPIYEPTSPIYTSLPPVYKQVLTERPLPPPVYIPEPPKQKIGKLNI